MNLRELINNLSLFDDEATIYASEPWSSNSFVLVEREPLDGGLPEVAQRQKLTYFLEVFVAKEVLEDAARGGHEDSAADAICERLIQYATSDA